MAAGNLVGALFYLRVHSLQNLLLSRLRRLRQPKYLVGAVIGIAYFYFVFGRRFGSRPRMRPQIPLEDLATGGATWFAILGAAALLVIVALCWILRRDRAALSFTEAEIAFLFPAPVGRRGLIHYRLVSLGLASIFTGLILGLFSASWPGVAGTFGMRAVACWFIFATFSLHIVGSSFALTRWQDRGNSPLVAQLLAIAVVAGLVGGPLLWWWHGMQAGTVDAIAATQSGPLAWLLFPFRLMLGPLLAADAHAFLQALWPVALIYAAHYLWVLQVQVGFEEASIVKAEKRAERLAAMRAGNFRFGTGKRKARRAPFDLGRAGRPELAFLWKNLLASAEYLRLRNAVICAALIVSGCLWFAHSGFFNYMRPALSMAVLIISGYTLLLGPQLARQDFRSDLPNTDILKTYPLRGWQVMLGEMLTPVAILTGILWLMILAGAMVAPSGMPKLEWLTPQVRIGGALGLALLVPLLCLSQLVIVNTAAVLLPAWQPGPGRAQQGIEVMGQRILFLVGQLLAMTFMLLPAALIGGVVFAIAHWLAGNMVGAAVALVVTAVVLAAELAAVILWLGQRFERLDLSTELRP